MAVDDPYLAMAELCLHDHARRSLSALGRDGGEAPVLVLAGPAAGGGISRMRDMFEAVRRYLPHASIWLYANEELLPLLGAKIHPTEAGDETPADSGVVTQAEGGPGAIGAARHSPRHLRLTEPLTAPTPSPDEDRPSEDETDEDESARITAEEIEMLLQRQPQPDEPSST